MSEQSYELHHYVICALTYDLANDPNCPLRMPLSEGAILERVSKIYEVDLEIEELELGINYLLQQNLCEVAPDRYAPPYYTFDYEALIEFHNLHAENAISPYNKSNLYGPQWITDALIGSAGEYPKYLSPSDEDGAQLPENADYLRDEDGNVVIDQYGNEVLVRVRTSEDDNDGSPTQRQDDGVDRSVCRSL